MLVTGVDMVLLFVTDMERSLAWYQGVLGLPLRFRHGDFAVLETGGVPLALHGGARPCGTPESHGTLLSLAVADYPAARATLEARGCAFTFENRSERAIFGTFADPDGTPLQIQGPLPPA